MRDTELGSTYTEGLKTHIEKIPQELLELQEKDLRKRIDPSLKLYEVKRAFWEELYQAQDEGRTMRMWRIYEGKYSKQYFYNHILKNPMALAWIISPLNSYENKTKAALDAISERYEELISMKITKKVADGLDENGNPKYIEEIDPKRAALLLAVIKNLEDRVKGTSVQRSLIATVEPGKGKMPNSVDMSTVEAKLKELEEKLNGPKKIAYTNDDAIDVEIKDD